MRIGIDATKAAIGQRTGTERYALDLLRAMLPLVPDDVEVRLYSPFALPPGLLPTRSNVQSHALRWPLRRLWYQGRLSMEMTVHAPDVLFMPAHTIPLIVPRRTITMIHDIGFERNPELYPAMELRYQRFALRWALKKAATIITPSTFTRDDVLSFFNVDPKRLVVIPHGCTRREQPSQEQRDKVRKKYSIDGPYIYSIGRLEKKKGTLTIVRAFSRIAKRNGDIHLVLAGKDGHGIQEICDALAASKAQQRIHLLGYVPEEDAHVLLAGARAYAFPSYYEGFGFPVLEAFDAGVPVIAHDIGALIEVGGNAILAVDHTQETAWDVPLERILSDEQIRSPLIAQGYERLQSYSWQICARATLDVLLKQTGNA